MQVNKLKNIHPQFKKVLKLSSQIAKDHDYKIYLVGGIVRDLLLGKPVFDLDIVVEQDAISFVEKLAGRLNKDFRRHHSFGTATLYCGGHKIDFATARKERYFRPGALPKVEASSLKNDLFRRDFTINAMAVSLNKKDYGKLLDFCGGLEDLKGGLIRILHRESFLDDSLRILRAIRFEQRFSFKIERKTNILMKEAVKKEALGWINPHRLRDELILFFSEPRPYRYIKRLYSLEKFNFIDKRLFLSKEDFKFFIRAQFAVNYYKKKVQQREIKAWIIYFTGVLVNLPSAKVLDIVNRLGFRKGERMIISSIKENLSKIKKLDKNEKPSKIYKTLNNYSYEAILFFYAYFPGKMIRRNIRLFLEKISFQKLKVAGRDLKKMGVESSSYMGKILQDLLYLKLDKGLKVKRQEIAEVKKIIKRSKQ